jgi:hypothetical protein
MTPIRPHAPPPHSRNVMALSIASRGVYGFVLYLGSAFIANRSSTGITTAANGVPASSDTNGSGFANSLSPSIEFL